jgi:hypothetical protein
VSEHPDLESAVPQLEVLLGDLVTAVLGEESIPIFDNRRAAAPAALSRLIVHDHATGGYLVVAVRAPVELIAALATNLLGVPDPAPDDMLDVIAELGNIAAGNVKTLLCSHGRLSLPSSALSASPDDDPTDSVRAAVDLFGHVLELLLIPVVAADAVVREARWPGAPMTNVTDRAQPVT